MEIHGHIHNGVVVPDDVLSLPEGTEVTILVRNISSTNGEAMSTDERARYLDALARIDAVANENPGDAFSGSDHDQVLYGNRG